MDMRRFAVGLGVLIGAVLAVPTHAQAQCSGWNTSLYMDGWFTPTEWQVRIHGDGIDWDSACCAHDYGIMIWAEHNSEGHETAYEFDSNATSQGVDVTLDVGVTVSGTTQWYGQFWVGCYCSGSIVGFEEAQGAVQVVVPELQLFLDTDAPGMSQAFENDFIDEYPTYLPGAIQGGVSEPVATVSGTGQYVRILAGFVNTFGVFMPAPPGATLEFGLASTSAWTGYAMNAGTSTDPDFALEGQNPAGFSQYYPYLAQIVLRARDYGGRTAATATLSTTNATAELRVPRPRDSSNVDSLPYAGWIASGVLVSTENQFVPHLDDEPDKNGGGIGATQGDGFSWYDEFRGAIVQGVHQRLNPQRKDLFVRSELTEGLGFATDLSAGGRPLTVWLIDANEMAANRNLNFNVSATSIIQKALVVSDGGYHADFIGATFTATPREHPGPRGVISPIAIYVERIREVTPTVNDKTTSDAVDPTAISKVIAHEIGHGVTIDHIVIPPPPQCDQSQPNPVPLTVMTSQVFVQTTSAAHPCWLPANIPTGYQPDDIDQLQLR